MSIKSQKKISLNQFAEYGAAKREATKNRIIRQQKVPNPFLIPWYQLAKSSIRKCLKEKGDLSPVYKALDVLQERVPKNKRQLIDRRVSIEALELFLSQKLPSVIGHKNVEIIDTPDKYLLVEGLNINVAPEVVFRLTKPNGKTTIGAIKLHVCKGKPFSIETATLASSIIVEYLKQHFKNEIIDPSLCFSLDVFAERVTPAQVNQEINRVKVIELSKEIIANWEAA